MTSSKLQDYLSQHSTSSHFIEYDGFLSNHLSHGIIALHRLQVPFSRIHQFSEWYVPRLETPSSDLEDNRPITDLIGERTAFYRILGHYENVFKDKYNSSLEDLIKGEYPNLSAGLAGSALHGTIHLGYSYSIRNERGVLEGLAYTYHSYRPVVSKENVIDFGGGTKDILTVLGDIRGNADLQEALKTGREKERWTSMKIGRFQAGICYLLVEQGDELVKYTSSLKIEDEFRSEDGSVDPVKLSRRMVYWAILAYTSAANVNDFFLLHGVTCAWGIYQFISLLDNDDVIDVLKHYTQVLFAVYLVQGAPALTRKIPQRKVTDADWTALIEKALETNRDEHCYKLLQVCRELAADALANGEEEHVYYQAACNSIENEFIFRAPS